MAKIEAVKKIQAVTVTSQVRQERQHKTLLQESQEMEDVTGFNDEFC